MSDCSTTEASHRAPHSVAPHLEGRTLILLSNREPYEHHVGSAGVEVRFPAGGLVSALDPTLRKTNGVWVAWGSGDADRQSSDANGRLRVPPEDPSYLLRRVWLDSADIEGYYLGFANSVLWPLCHMLLQHVEFREEHWDRYIAVNERFAAAVLDEARHTPQTPSVWIQDYHFALVAGMLKAQAPDLFVHQFWHIPFPPPDVFRLLPLGVETVVLQGLAANDLMAFQTERYARNFLDAMAQMVPEAVVDMDAMQVTIGDHVCHVGTFPISIDYDAYEAAACAGAGERLCRALRQRYASERRQLGVCVDRMDYTKGLLERMRVLEYLWTESPELRGTFTMLFVATPSRTDLDVYQTLAHELETRVLALNAAIGTSDWTPIVLINDNVDADVLAGAYRAADLCLVSSVQDGMNLVAKEFIACQIEERGVLLLSRFTGAAETIDGAVLINPFNLDGFATGIRQALAMPLAERETRMRQMRAQLKTSTIFEWLDAILERAQEIAQEIATGAAAHR